MRITFAECDGCKRTIFFAVSEKKRKGMPLDAIACEGGTFTLQPNRDPEDSRPVAVFVPPRGRSGPLYISHFATCPAAQRFRPSRVGGHSEVEETMARLQLQAAEIEADRLAEELIALTKAKVGHWPIYLECRLEWPAFCAAHRNVDRRVLELVSEACNRKLHPKEAQLYADTLAKRFIPSEARSA